MKTKKITRSHHKLDPDIKAVFATWRALKGSSSDKMLEANLSFVAGHFGFGIYPLVKETLRVSQLAKDIK